MHLVVDLSHPLTASGGSYCHGHPIYNCERICSLGPDDSNVSRLTLGSHTGTHVDAPVHFIAEGATISDLDLSILVGPAVIVDVRGRTPHDALTWSDFEPYEDRIGKGVMVLVCTGWSKHWGTQAYFPNPRVTVDVARRLGDRGVRVIGIDALSPDGMPAEGEVATHAVHKEFLGRGGVIAENLTNLEVLLGSEGWVVSLLPLNLEGCDGSPIRAVAWKDGR
ncbi:putative cyclase [Amylostereum chailletii]|nr:putative cyclase [Amylostereum chailletii]